MKGVKGRHPSVGISLTAEEDVELILAGLLILGIQNISQSISKYFSFWQGGCGSDTCRASNLRYSEYFSKYFKIFYFLARRVWGWYLQGF